MILPKESKMVIKYELVFNKVSYDEVSRIYEDDKITVDSFPLDHGIDCTGYLFNEKKTYRKLNKPKSDHYGLSIEDIVNVKRGQDFITKDGETIPNDELTIDSRTPRAYAYCSDTAFKEDLIPIVKGVDLLYHESTFMQEHAERAKMTKHSTASEAAEIAKRAEVSKLVLGHFSARYKDLTPLLNEAKDVFENSVLATDGAVFEVK